MNKTVLIFGGFGKDQTRTIQSGLNAAGIAVWSPEGNDDWKHWRAAPIGQCVVVGHSWGQEAVREYCGANKVSLAMLIDPVRRAKWYDVINPFAEIDAPKADSVRVFYAKRRLYPFPCKVKGYNGEYFDGDHNSVCHNLRLVAAIVDAVRAV